MLDSGLPRELDADDDSNDEIFAEFGFGADDRYTVEGDALDDEDRRNVTPKTRPCPGVMNIIVRKKRGGGEPFSAETEAKLCEALQLASNWAWMVKQIFDKIMKQGGTRKKRTLWNACPPLLHWMGKAPWTREEIRKAQLRATRISRKFGKPGVRFIIIQHDTKFRSYLCNGKKVAYTTPSTGIKLCPLFFTNDRKKRLTKVQRAMTIIHELVHTLGWGHFRLPSGKAVKSTHKQADNAVTLAELKPWRARRNPVNYAWMYRETSEWYAKWFLNWRR